MPRLVPMRKLFGGCVVGACLIAGTTWVAIAVRGGSEEIAAAVPTLDDLQVGGVVFADLDNDGLLDNGEPGIEGLSVRIASRGAGTEIELVTAGDGSFAHHTGALSTVTVGVQVPTPAPAGENQPVVVVVERLAHQGSPVAIPVYGRALDCVEPTACPDLLLPDLVSLGDTPPSLNAEQRQEYPSPTEWFIDTQSQPGRALLRVATVSSNQGAGPVAIVGVNQSNEGHTGSVQRLFTSTLGYVDVPSEVLHFHDSHQHVHIDAYQELVLRDGEGVVASNTKISFCLTDVFAAGAVMPEWRPVRLDLRLFDCGYGLQGINTGMTDYYGAMLPDQYVDVTGVPPGMYHLDIVVDPRNRIVESDEGNNVVTINVRIPSDG